MINIQFPPPLQKGDLLRVIAPSGTLKELGAVEEGLKIWRSQGYRVELGKYHHTQWGYLAGTDEERRQDLQEAWTDPNCKAILCLRGGYGSARLLENWQWTTIDTPKWLIGFSDVTGLLWSLARQGISSIHGPVLTTIAAEPTWSLDRLFNFLRGKPLENLEGKPWGGGKTEGRLLPANLTVATHFLGTPIQPNLEGVILALEDVTEAPYRIDRLLTQWRMMGVLTQIRGIALGRFSRCKAPVGSNSWGVEEVLLNRLGDLGLPIVSDLPFGHDGANAALPVGHIVQLDGDQGLLNFESGEQ
jgi:muramoyltetrapeptide carboxypeptidase